jgi:ribosomal protein S18 acetylase RimI-like enzyme
MVDRDETNRSVERDRTSMAAAAVVDPPAGYDLMSRVPTTVDHSRLRAISGLTPRSDEAADVGLPNSLHSVCVLHGGIVIGMGRIVGDGGLFFHLVDVAVDPAHQSLGLGRSIVAALLAWIERTAPAKAYVTLIANGGASRLYEHLGFEDVLPDARGMAFWVGGSR